MANPDPAAAGAVECLRLPAGGLTLTALAHGPADGPPVLALHGWLDNAASFDALAPHLPGIRLVALDLPGHGHADHRPPGTRYHFIDYVDDVLAAADALGWDRFSLLGHSLGGAIACFVAAACPQRIRQLALIEGIGPLTGAAAETPGRLARAFAPGQSGPGRPARPYARLDDAVRARRAVGDLGAGAARALVERATIATEQGIVWRSDSRLRRLTPVRYTEEQVLAVLAAIRAPASLVVASDGLLAEWSDWLQPRIDAVEQLVMHSCPGGHHLHMDRPAPVAAALAAALHGGDNGHTHIDPAAARRRTP